MYTVNLEKARKALPAAAVKDFDDIVEQRVLGASESRRSVSFLFIPEERHRRR